MKEEMAWSHLLIVVTLLFSGASWAFPAAYDSPSNLALIAGGVEKGEKLNVLLKKLATDVPKIEVAIEGDITAIDAVLTDILSWDIPFEDVSLDPSCPVDSSTSIDAGVLKNFQAALDLLKRGNAAFENSKAGKYQLTETEKSEADKELALLSQVIADGEWSTSDCNLLLNIDKDEPSLVETQIATAATTPAVALVATQTTSMALVETQTRAGKKNQIGLRLNTKMKTKAKNPFKWLYHREVDMIFSLPRLWAAHATSALLQANGLPWLTRNYRVAFDGGISSLGHMVTPGLPGSALIITPSAVHPRLKQVTVAAGRSLSLFVARYQAPSLYYVVQVQDGAIDGNAFPINWLPWDADHCTWMFLNPAIHNYVTSDLSGCSLFLATNGANPPIVMHCNANTVYLNRIAARDTPAQAELVSTAQKQTDANNVIALNAGYAIVQTIVKADYNGGHHKAFVWGTDNGGAWRMHAHHFYKRMIGHPQNTV